MILAISRAEKFSPNSVDKDAAILENVMVLLRKRGNEVLVLSESDIKEHNEIPEAQAYISMGRLPKTLLLLQEKNDGNHVVINSSDSVSLCCNRRKLKEVLTMAGVPLAPSQGDDGYWLKKAEGVTESPNDICFAVDEKEMLETKKRMIQGGIDDVLVSAHIVGDLIKFYGVRGSDFFMTFYPSDDGKTKFDDELHNGMPHHYIYSIDALKNIADRAAEASGLDVYGGDCIVRSDGSIVIIDFNDWPSFSRCREQAAIAICDNVEKKLIQRNREIDGF